MTALISGWAKLLLQHRLKFLAILLMMAFVALASAGNIRFEDGIRQIFKSEHPVFQRFEEAAQNTAQSDGQIFVLASSRQRFTGTQLEKLRDFNFDGQLVEGISFATSIFSQQKYDSNAGDLVNILPDDLANVENTDEILSEARRFSFGDIPLINHDQNKTILLFTLEEVRPDVKGVAPPITELRALMDEAEQGSDLEMSMSGLTPIRHRIVDNLKREQILLNVIGGILGTLVALFMFRSFWIACLNGIAPAFALIFTFGSFGIFGISMNVITNSVSALILVLAMADSIHMTHELRRKLTHGDDIDKAIRGMMTEIGPPSLLTGLTTMIAFASLFYSQSALIESFATAGLASLCAAAIAILTVHPLVFRFAWEIPPVRKALQKPLTARQRSPKIAAGLTVYLLRRQKIIPLFGLAILALMVPQFLPVKTDHQFQEYLDKTDPMIATMAEIEDISAPSQAITIAFRPLEPDADLLGEEYLDEIGKAHRLLEARFPDNKILSIKNMMDMLPEDDFEAQTGKIREFLEIMPERARRSIIGKDADALMLTFLTKDEHSRAVRELSGEIQNALGGLKLRHLKVQPPAGLHFKAAFMSDIMIKEMVISFLIAAMLCPLLIAVWYRRWSYGAAAIMPNILPVLIVGSFLIHYDGGIRFTSAIALTIAFGIAVDDTIHLLNRYDIMRRQNPGWSSHRMNVSAVRHVFPALVTTTCVLTAGMASSLTSAMPTVVFFGLLCISIFFLALIADLLLLPPALAFFERVAGR